MPKRKSVEANVEPAVSKEQKKRTSAKPKTSAATHKRASKLTFTPEAAPKTVIEVAPPVARPSHADIAKLAYSYWEARGFAGGCPEEDWLRAERELSAIK